MEKANNINKTMKRIGLYPCKVQKEATHNMEMDEKKQKIIEAATNYCRQTTKVKLLSLEYITDEYSEGTTNLLPKRQRKQNLRRCHFLIPLTSCITSGGGTGKK
mmetsp:Transcript_8341/g.15939  ORF Transcript_8341/g.15939 Transcript_8341/m.15939 type:complete len:104 (+) Transcript_8341:53-364(+)